MCVCVRLGLEEDKVWSTVPTAMCIPPFQGHCCLVLGKLLLFGLELDQLQNKGLDKMSEQMPCHWLGVSDDIFILGPRRQSSCTRSSGIIGGLSFLRNGT